MDGQAYQCELSKCMIDADANLLGQPLETQPQASAEANQPACVSPSCSAGCCVVLGPVAGQGGLLPDCACARGSRFRGCKRRIWRSSELSTLVLLHSALGNKWSAIAKYLHGRTDNDCKNIFYSALRSKTSQTNRLLRTYAQAVGPNCDDPIARQNAYKAAKAQVAARNATLISRAAALAPRARQASARGASTSDDDSDIPADAAAAAAQAAAALPHSDAAAAAAAAATNTGDGDIDGDADAPEDMDPMDADAYVNALQLQQATTAAAAATAAAASGGTGSSMETGQQGNNPRIPLRRLSAQSGNRDSSVYVNGSGSPSSLTPSFTQEPPSVPSRSRSLSYRDIQEPQAASCSRQHPQTTPPPQSLPPSMQHMQQQQQPPWAMGRALLPPMVPHPLRHVRPRLIPYGMHPSPLSGMSSQDNQQLTGPQSMMPAYLPYCSPAVAAFAAANANEAGGNPPELFSSHMPAAASSSESPYDTNSIQAPPRRRSGGNISAAVAAAAAAAAATTVANGGSTAASRRDRIRERDAGSCGGSSSSSFGGGVAKNDWSPNRTSPAGSPTDSAVLQVSAAAGQLHLQPPPPSQSQGQQLYLMPAAGNSGFVPDASRTSSGHTLHLPSTTTPPPTRTFSTVASLPPFPASQQTLSCDESLSLGTSGPAAAAAGADSWATPPLPQAVVSGPATTPGAPAKYEMIVPPAIMLCHGGAWELGCLEGVPSVTTASTAGGPYSTLPPQSSLPLLPQQHPYQLQVALQAQLQAQQQQLQEQQQFLQAQLAQLQALQHQQQHPQHHPRQQQQSVVQAHGQSQSQSHSHGPTTTWMAGSGHVTSHQQQQQQQQQQPPSSSDDGLAEMWLSMLE